MNGSISGNHGLIKSKVIRNQALLIIQKWRGTSKIRGSKKGIDSTTKT